MRKKHTLKIGVDVDDVLYSCNQHAIDLLSQERDLGGLSIHDINSWGAGSTASVLDERHEYFSSPDFVKNQPVIPGAEEFIKKLSEKGEVFFVTAVGGTCMSERAKRLLKDFPEVPERNIIIGSRKDLVALDILLDDGAHNILGSCARYPVLFRRPWNNNLTGLLAVNSYDDFLRLVDQIRGNGAEDIPSLADGGVVCLVGPTGAGKRELAELLTKKHGFVRPVTTTTRAMRDGEQGLYNFTSKKNFENAQDRGEFLEFTVYGGHYYGCRADDVSTIMEQGRIAVMPIDICGAIAVKNAFPGRCVIAFTDRSRRAVLKHIIGMDCTEDEKVLRILSLDSEFRNREICDLIINMDGGAEKGAAELLEDLGPVK